MSKKILGIVVLGVVFILVMVLYNSRESSSIPLPIDVPPPDYIPHNIFIIDTNGEIIEGFKYFDSTYKNIIREYGYKNIIIR
jgi:hypothetical protein